MLTLDLHPIFRNTRAVDLALREIVFRAAATGEDFVEIIPGKGSGQLKRRVLAFLNQPQIKKLHRGVEADAGNSGRVLVRFKDGPGPGPEPGRPSGQ